MQQGINIEEVKKYNASLKAYKDQSAKLRAEIDFNERELSKQCEELSLELGMTVTPENIQSILEQRIDKINNTMAIGIDILNRIRQEEESLQNQFTQPIPMGMAQNQFIPTPSVPTPSVPVQPTMQPTPPVQQYQSYQAPQTSAGAIDMSGELPPIFGR